MKKPFMALIVPMKREEEGGGGEPPHPDHTLPGDLPRPEHPIFLPLPPGAPVDPDYGIDIDAPYPDQGLPGEQPYPDQGLPGEQPHPDQGLPGDQPHPEHPIVLPPGSGGWLPVFIWNQPHPDQGLPTDPHPDHSLPPVELPGEGEMPEGPIDWKPMWTAENGWQVIGVVSPPDSALVPTPSQGRQQQGPQRGQQQQRGQQSNRPSRQQQPQGAPKPSGIPGRGGQKPQPPRPPSRRR